MIKNTNNSLSLFSNISDILNQSHPLYQLADKIDWGKFETAFQPLFCQANGNPGKPIRLMCGMQELTQSAISFMSREHNVSARAKNIRNTNSLTRLSIIRSFTGIILSAMSFNNEYDGHTIGSSQEQVERLAGQNSKYRQVTENTEARRKLTGQKL